MSKTNRYIYTHPRHLERTIRKSHYAVIAPLPDGFTRPYESAILVRCPNPSYLKPHPCRKEQIGGRIGGTRVPLMLGMSGPRDPAPELQRVCMLETATRKSEQSARSRAATGVHARPNYEA
jgi:hypothetical protein